MKSSVSGFEVKWCVIDVALYGIADLARRLHHPLSASGSLRGGQNSKRYTNSSPGHFLRFEGVALIRSDQS
jgi:hypothetical protein